jgi:hypothetical protein
MGLASSGMPLFARKARPSGGDAAGLMGSLPGSGQSCVPRGLSEIKKHYNY